MKHTVKRTLLFSLCLLLMEMSSGCQYRESTVESAGLKQVDYDNTYMEEEIALPEGIKTVADMTLTKEGIRIAGTDTSRGIEAVWISRDYGGSWEQEYSYSDLIGSDKGQLDACLSDDGSLVVAAVQEDDRKEHYLIKDKKTELLTEHNDIIDKNELTSLSYLGHDWLIGANKEFQYVLFNKESGEIETILSDGEILRSFEYRNDILYLGTPREFRKYNVKEQTEEGNKEIPSKLQKRIKNANGLNLYSFAVVPGTKGAEYYYANREGIVTYVDGKERGLISGEKCSLGNKNYALQEIAALNDKTIVAQMDTDTGTRLVRYKPRNVSSDNRKTLKIFSLEENVFLSQAINLYQTLNPSVDITFDVASNRDVNFAISDTLKKLNVDIESGNGPDIILLDGLNIDNYAVQGILKDLSGQILPKQTELISSVVDTYKVKDQLYALPLRFSLMTRLQAGSQEMNDSIGLKEFINDFNMIQLDVPNFDIWSLDQIISVYYRMLFEAADLEELNEETLESFYENIKVLSETEDLTEVLKEPQKNLTARGILPVSYGDIEIVAANKFKASADYIDSVDSYSTLQRFAKEGTANYKIMGKNGKFIYVPQTVIGINAKGRQIGNAEEFLNFLISKEGQNSYLAAGGLPINYASLANMEYGILEQAEKEELSNIVNNLGTSCKSNYTMQNIVMEQADNLLRGDITVSEAADNAYRKLKLYLAE